MDLYFLLCECVITGEFDTAHHTFRHYYHYQITTNALCEEETKKTFHFIAAKENAIQYCKSIVKILHRNIDSVHVTIRVIFMCITKSKNLYDKHTRCELQHFFYDREEDFVSCALHALHNTNGEKERTTFNSGDNVA